MDPESVVFWGITLKPGDPTDLDLKMGESLHVTMASFGPQLKEGDGRSVVSVKVGDSQAKFAVCALTAGKTESTVLDIQFTGEEKVIFTLSGKNEVHLVGNFVFVDMEDSDDTEEEDLIDVYHDDAMGEQSDDSEEVEAPTLMIDNDPPIITEVKEDKDEDEDEDEDKDKGKGKGAKEEKESVKAVKAKKAKQSKGPAKANGKTPEKQNLKTPEKHGAKKTKAEKSEKVEKAGKAEQAEKTEKAEQAKPKLKPEVDKVKTGPEKTQNVITKQKPHVKKTAKSDEKAIDEKSTPMQTGKRKNAGPNDTVTPSKKAKNDKKAAVEKTPEKVEGKVSSGSASADGADKSAEKSSKKKKKNRRRGKVNSS